MVSYQVELILLMPGKRNISSLLAKSRPLVDFPLIEDGVLLQFPKLNVYHMYMILLLKIQTF